MNLLAFLGFGVDSSGLRRGQQDLDRFRGAALGAGAANDRMRTSAMGAGTAVGTLGRIADSTRMAVGRLVSGMGSLVLATFGLRAAITTLANFEQSMARVLAVTGASTSELNRLREEARRLGATTEFTASQVAEGLFALGQAGFSTAEAVSAINGVVDLATAAVTDLGAASGITANILRAFGMEASRASDVSDVLALTASRTQTDVLQLGDAIKYVGPVASVLGISLGDVTAAVGALSDAGLQGSMAGTGLRRILSELTAATPQATRAIEALGLSLAELNPSTVSILDIVERLAAAGLDAGEAFTIFGDKGAPAILALTEALPKLRMLTEEMRGAAGAGQRMADVMRNSLMGSFRNLASAAEAVVISIGDAGLTGILRGLAEKATEALRTLAEHIDIVLIALGALAARFVAFPLAAFLVGMSRALYSMVVFDVATRRVVVSLTAANVAAVTFSRTMAIFGGVAGFAVTIAAASIITVVSKMQEANRYAQLHAEIMEEVSRRYRESAEGAAALTESERLRSVLALTDQLNAALRDQASILQDLSRGLGRTGEPRDPLGALLGSETAALRNISEAVREQANAMLTAETTLDEFEQALLDAAVANIGVNETFREQFTLLATVARALANADATVDELRARLAELQDAAQGAAAGLSGLGDAATEVASGFADAIAVMEGFIPALERARKMQEDLATNDAALRTGQEDLLRRLSSGMISEELYRDAMARLREAHRAARDEITGTADTQRDLLEQFNEFLRAGNESQMSPHMRAVNELTEAYRDLILQMEEAGLLTPERATQLRTAIDQQMGALAIDAMPEDPPGGSWTQNYDAARESFVTRLRDLQMEAQTLGMTTREAEAYRMEQELINAAVADNIELTPAFLAGIEAAADDYKKLGEELDTYKRIQDEINQRWDMIGQGILDIAKSSKNGIEAMIDAAQRLADALLDALLMGALLGTGPFGSMFGLPADANGQGGGFLGQLFASMFHRGGVVGEANDNGRLLPAAAFAGAPRLHTGMFGPREYPAVLERGESVLTPGQMRQVAGAGRPLSVRFEVVDRAGVEVRQNGPARQDQNGEVAIPIVIERIALGAVNREMNTPGSPTSRSMETNYGLQRRR